MISVVINTYNAERHLAECLEAVKDFDEIVVCDMESNDRTVEIAQRYGCKIVTYPKGDCVSAEPARTFAIQSASSEWVLVVDSDEIITPELRQYLYERTQVDDGVKGLYIARLNKIFGAYNRGWSNDYQLRFFIREGTEWPPYVHTFPKVNGRVEKAPRRYKMLHLADETTVQLIAKMNQYTDSEVEKKADPWSWRRGVVHAPVVPLRRQFLLPWRFQKRQAWPPLGHSGSDLPIGFGVQDNREKA